MKIKTIFLYLCQASVLIPIYYGIRHFKALTGPYKLLFYFFLFAVLFEVQAEIARRVFQNNMLGQHLYSIIEFIAFSAVFYMQLQKKNRLRYLMVANAIVFLSIAIANIILASDKTNDWSRGYSSYSLILYSLCYLYHLFTIDDTLYMWEYPMFWYCTATLVGFAPSALYIVTKGRLLVLAPETEKIFQLGYDTLNIIVSLLYAQTFRCLGKYKQQM